MTANRIENAKVDVVYFDAGAFETHHQFYQGLPIKPHIVVYAAGFQVTNEEALQNWNSTFQMMKVHYCGTVSILNIIATDLNNRNLERIVGEEDQQRPVGEEHQQWHQGCW